MPSLLRALANVGVLSVFVFMFAFPARGQDTTEVERLRNGNIGFISEREDDTEIFEMRPDGSGATQLTHNTAVTDLSPDWSPEGSKIAFTSHQPGSVNFDIYIMNADGSNPERLTRSPDGEFEPTWSPDGSQIAFERDISLAEGVELPNIFVMNADRSDQAQLLPSRTSSEYAPDWSPDGSQIAFVRTEPGGDQIYAVNIDGSDLTQLTRDSDYTNSSPEWSPDGSKILFSRQFGTSVAAKTDVHVMNANGSDVENLTNQPEVNDGDATWSPDGRQIAFVRGDCSEFSPDVQNPCDIWRMRADGSSPTQITRNTDDNYSPDWLPFGAGVIAQGNGDDTGNAGTDTAADDQYNGGGNNDGGGDVSNDDGGDVNNPKDVIPDTTSKKPLPNTGGVPLLGLAVCALALVGVGFSVLRTSIRRDP